ncbi:hypothetical protein BDV41DRAFT_539379 [Aspergillus transmontanensis]|uniref:Uncharacterized protein n=1 Tax=Aspergillus transmontanensis TaxID=1034304 RepID=A0A5N6VUR3_9EURO|nr:hypothetical protein BDV41DRAFT_539379 [Aspergillus transmontanensis]
MDDNFRIWIEEKRHSVEGHLYHAELKFHDRIVWSGTCHENTHRLKEALEKSDSRWELEITRKDKTIEGHTRQISVLYRGEIILDRLSTHPNMDNLVQCIESQYEKEASY